MTDTAVAEKSAQLRDGRTAAILRPAEITPRARVRRRPHHPDGLPSGRRQGLPQRHHRVPAWGRHPRALPQLRRIRSDHPGIGRGPH